MANISKYKDVESYILNGIREGIFQPGDRLPTEKELQEMFGISRMTVNKAMRGLTESGYIERTAGKGSFVSYGNIRREMKMTGSLTEDLRRNGLVPGSVLISYEVKRADGMPEAKEQLGLRDDDLVHFMIRLRTGDGKPFAMTYTYVPVREIPAIDVSSLSGSFFQTLRNEGIQISRTVHSLSAVLPDEREKEMLGIGRAAVLRDRRVTYLQRGGEQIPFIYTVADYRGDLYSCGYVTEG